MVSTDPHSRNLRIGRYSEPLVCYSITKAVFERQRILAESIPARILLDSWSYLRSTEQIKVIAFCIMPDHYHLLMFLFNKTSLSDVMESTNKFTARSLNKHFGSEGTFWQNGFHDHRCRDEDDIHELKAYIEHNPVRAGLVDRAQDWPYSSACPTNSDMLDLDWYAEKR